MRTLALSGDDSLIINGRILSDLGDGDYATMTFENDIASVSTGKNSNAVYASNTKGREATMTLRIIRGSADDRFLNNLLNQQNSVDGFGRTVLMNGEYIKKIGDGEGNVRNDARILSGGIFTSEVEFTSNSEGETEQSLAIYNMKFATAPRAIT